MTRRGMDLLPNHQTSELLHLDVCLDELTPQPGIIQLLKTLRPQWRAEDLQLKVFTEGITNQLLGCSVSTDTAVVLVRVFGRATELFINRQKELEMLKLLHSHGCGPKLYCSFHNGICYEFLKGVALDDVLVRQPLVYRLVAGELGKLHSIKPTSISSVEPVLWSKLANYIKLLRNCEKENDVLWQGWQTIPSVDVLLSETEELKRHLNRLESPTVLCHNDLLIKNIIYNSEEGVVKFIDYEYADFNYQAYDIANHFNEFAGVDNVDYSLYPSRELQWDWLSSYLQSLRTNSRVESHVTQGDVNTLYIQVCKFTLVAHLNWGMWALLQAKYSTINFDFLKYAAARFSHYFEMKDEYLGMPFP
ncbi:ethanolamine kinase 1 [Clarias gariepinus]|uniref:ethanolamine kinase 1 n=1 Tax=Clarias gariepinus TaxID=13013 RepID=UPI00234D4D5B|nr:ethanolamine kinase 1 [Clarias gariepinus]